MSVTIGSMSTVLLYSELTMSEDTVIYQGITRHQTKCYISPVPPLLPSPYCNTQQTKLTFQAILQSLGNTTWLDSVELGIFGTKVISA